MKTSRSKVSTLRGSKDAALGRAVDRRTRRAVLRQAALEVQTSDFVAKLRETSDPVAILRETSSGQRDVEAPHSKPKNRKKKPRLVQLLAPLDCTILAVDAAEVSGWALWRAGQLLDFGEVDVFSTQVGDVFDAALALTGPHVLVVERPFQVRSGFSVGIGTGEKIWREYAKRHGFAKRILRVFPPTWRSHTLPKGMASAKRAIVRPVEVRVARDVAAHHLGGFMREAVGDDSAPAILIGQWATFCPLVEKLLPKKRAKQVPLALPNIAPKKKRARKAVAA